MKFLRHVRCFSTFLFFFRVAQEGEGLHSDTIAALMGERERFADADEGEPMTEGQEEDGLLLGQASLGREQLQKWLDGRGAPHLGDDGSEGDESDEEELDDDDDDDDGEWGRVEDADWELARGDFTKMFNRSRQLAQVVNHDSSTASGSHSSTVPLPAMNRARRPAQQSAASSLHQSAVDARSTSSSKAAAGGPSKTPSKTPVSKTGEQLSSLNGHFYSRLHVQDAFDPSASAGGAVSGHVPRKGNAGTGEKRVRDKSDRSTVQQVLDPRTLAILFKMLQKGLLKQVNGVISTGKEANVYHASTYKYPVSSEMISSGETAGDEEEGIPLALKIYKTSILVFKDRDRYITGEFRFRHGYSRHNPRKMVKLWAEKEARNLKRLMGSGICCPRPLELRDHVLVMEYLQEDSGSGRNSPRLKDAEDIIDARRDAGEESVWEDLYVEMLVAMRTMFHQCRLVHADLSEYNVL